MVETSSAASTAQDFINVKNIKGNILYTKDDKIFVYIKIQPIGIELMSQEDQTAFTNNIVQELSTESKPFRLVKVSRPVDIAGLINDYSELLRKTTEPKKKALINADTLHLSGIALEGKTLEDQFFFILWEKLAEQSVNDLLKRADDFMRKLNRSKLYAALCDQAMIVQLCNLFTNPAYAHIESADIEPNIPILESAK